MCSLQCAVCSLLQCIEIEAFNSLAELAGKTANNPAEMWKRLKALSEQKPSHVLLEILCDDGTISSNKKEVLLKWHRDFNSICSVYCAQC